MLKQALRTRTRKAARKLAQREGIIASPKKKPRDARPGTRPAPSFANATP